MILPSFRRLFKGDFPQDQQNLVDKLGVSLNNGIEVLYNALNKNISLKDNLLATVKDLTVQVNSSGIPTQDLGFKVDFKGRISGVTVLRVINNTNNTVYPTGSPFISFTQNDTTLLINHITGLQTGYSWSLRVVAYGE